ncbi:MAG: energy-coupling factor transporter transmembrane component T, partial [Gammaproteobacteria bacterium]|nr:energy-coupling factor transporter transmembrane component T [Gammaproteobacteria bacterium]
EATREGFVQGTAIWLKANGIVLLLAALLGTIELVDLGHALAHLRVPPKLTHLLLFTVRYLGLMLAEYERLSRAARVRGFAPGLNRHTLRTTGYMVGMILVRSYARGERIRDAMRLRGFQGQFSFRGDMALRLPDAGFALSALIVLALLLGMERQ